MNAYTILVIAIILAFLAWVWWQDRKAKPGSYSELSEEEKKQIKAEAGSIADVVKFDPAVLVQAKETANPIRMNGNVSRLPLRETDLLTKGDHREICGMDRELHRQAGNRLPAAQGS